MGSSSLSLRLKLSLGRDSRSEKAFKERKTWMDILDIERTNLGPARLLKSFSRVGRKLWAWRF